MQVLDVCRNLSALSHPASSEDVANFVFGSSNKRDRFEGGCVEPVKAATTTLPRSKWSVILLRLVMRTAVSEVFQSEPRVENRKYDKKFHLRSSGRELECVVRDVHKKTEKHLKTFRLQWSVTEEGHGGKNKLVVH